ncbi:hypothetical protein RB195_020344 [Necator americanus]|uniref:Uncharacterized protein n=1 Tax=Necator americanus TaxID=51031 RepID=A0ABR1CK71_NECAM
MWISRLSLYDDVVGGGDFTVIVTSKRREARCSCVGGCTRSGAVERIEGGTLLAPFLTAVRDGLLRLERSRLRNCTELRAVLIRVK